MKFNFSTSSFRALAVLILSGMLGTAVLTGCQSADSATTPAETTDVAPAPAIEAGTYQLDGSHSEVGFRVRHLGISTVKGSFNVANATITVPGNELAGLQVEATIDAASITTGDVDRDNHLRSPDFFAVEEFPEITFVSREVVPGDGGRFTLNGDLTIRGVTKPVSLDAEYLGVAADPWGNQKIAFTAEGTINRTDFGLTWNKALETGGVLVGEEVTLVLDIQAAKQN